jgi:uncharacterized protein (TIGR02145 family)
MNSQKSIIHFQQSSTKYKLLVISCSLLVISCSLFTISVFSQGVGINSEGLPAHRSSILDVSSTSKGMLITRMTTAQRDSISIKCACIPEESLLIFNIITKCFEGYVNGSWASLVCMGKTCNPPVSPVEGTNTPSETQITWNWNSVNGATGYKFNTANDYAAASDNGMNLFYNLTGLTCNTAYTLYLWSYNSCGNSEAIAMMQSTSCCPPAGCEGQTTMIDSRDSKIYNIIQIGTQCWFAENLNYGNYVPIHTSAQASGEKYCTNHSGVNDPTCPIGGLYEWANMMNGSLSCNGNSTCPACSVPVQGPCPDGWHIPSHNEWTLLEKNAGSNPNAFPYDEHTRGWLGSDEGSNLKEPGTAHWQDPNICTPPGSCNSSGFTAYPGGFCYNGAFSSPNYSWDGLWWSTTEFKFDLTEAWCRGLNSLVFTVDRDFNLKQWGFAIRCVKD